MFTRGLSNHESGASAVSRRSVQVLAGHGTRRPSLRRLLEDYRAGWTTIDGGLRSLGLGSSNNGSWDFTQQPGPISRHKLSRWLQVPVRPHPLGHRCSRIPSFKHWGREPMYHQQCRHNRQSSPIPKRWAIFNRQSSHFTHTTLAGPSPLPRISRRCECHCSRTRTVQISPIILPSCVCPEKIST